MNDIEKTLNLSVGELLTIIQWLMDNAGKESGDTVGNNILASVTSNNVKYKDLDELLKKRNYKVSEDKKTYRKRNQLPDPSKPAYSEVNRLKKQFKMRLDSDFIEKISQKAEEEGFSSNQEFVENLIRQKLEP